MRRATLDGGWRRGAHRVVGLGLALTAVIVTSGAQTPAQGPAPGTSLFLVPNRLAEQLTLEAIPIHQYPDSLLASVPAVGRLPRRLQSLLTQVRDVDRVRYRAYDGSLDLPPDTSALPPGNYLVGFTGPIDPAWRSLLASTGLTVLDTASPYGLLVRGDGATLSALTRVTTSFGFDAVRGIVPLPLEARIDPDLLALARGEAEPDELPGISRTATGLATIRVETFPGRDTQAVLDAVRGIAESDSSARSRGETNVFVVRGPEILEILQRNPDVAYIEAVHERTLHDNLAAKAYILNVEPVWTEPSLGFTGAGVIVDHNDSGVDLTHPDFPAGTVVANAGAMSGTDTGHGTHTAGSVLGRGLAGTSPTNVSGCGDLTTPLSTIRGMAWNAQLVTNNIFDGGFATETSMLRWGYQQGARISTNSWGYVSLYTYSSHASTVDGLVRDADSTAGGNQDLLVFFSAGNDGPGSGTIGSPGTAKNVVTIGASQNDRCGAYIPTYCTGPDIDSIACFSSRGPAQGRIKPDLVAAGTDVLSTESSDPMATNPWDQSWTGSAYATDSGTSMSTPLSAGAAAVFFEFYKDRFGNFPSPALAKAALINGATDLGLGFPSFDQGWGRLNLRQAIEGPSGGDVKFFDQTDVSLLGTGSNWSQDFEVLSNSAPLKVTLAWTDPPAPGGSTSPLVNDLDLVVTEPGGTVYRGNLFSGSWSIPDPGPTTDTVNNVENVFVRTPVTGTWTIAVSSALTATNPPNLSGQDFALVYSGDVAECLAPPAPTGLVATAPGANRIDLSWNAEPSAASYNVYRSTSSGGPYESIANVTGTSHVDLSVSGGTTFYYVVTSVGGGGCESLFSNEDSALASGDCTLPPSFAGLESVSPSSGTCAIDLSWSEGTSNCSGSPVVYNLYRSTVPGFTPGPTNLVETCVSATSYTDTNVASATTYYYIARAEDATSAGGGPCNGGNVDSNVIEIGGASALTPTLLYSNDFEGADDFVHTPDVGGKADSWQGIQTSCAAASGTGVYRFGGASCTANYANDAFASAGPSTTVSVPAGALNVTMSFSHRYEFEDFSTGVYDGGYIAASVNGSPFAPVQSGRLSGHVYDAVIDGGCSNGIGTEVFTGTSSGYAVGSYLTTTVDLDGVCDDVSGGSTGCAGLDVQFRFTAVTDCATFKDGWLIDDVSVDADLAGACTIAPDPVSFFTVTSKNETNELVWLNPASGGSLTIAYRTDDFPTGPSDGSQLFPPPGTPDATQTFTHSLLTNGTTYYYGAYVGDGFGNFSAGRFTSGRPQDVSGRTAWVYQTGATSVVPPAVSSGIVWVVSNDRILHSAVGGESPGSGMWPAGYVPQALNATQARPPVVPISLLTASQVLFASTLDGDVHALDANSGSDLWSSPVLAERFQAPPTAMFSTFGGAYDLVFVGTRNTSSDNEIIALQLSTGMEAWSFDNGGGADAIGIISGSASVNYGGNKLVFASRSPAGGSPNTLWCIEFTDLGATLLWARAIGDIDGSPVVYRGRVYVGTNSSKVYAINLDDGTDLWTGPGTPFDAADGPIKGFVWPRFGTTELIIATTNELRAITDNGMNATEKWQVTSIPSPSTPLFIPGTNMLYVGGGDGRIYELDLSTNPPTIQFEQLGAGASAVGAPSYAITEDMIYVGTTLGAIYALRRPF